MDREDAAVSAIREYNKFLFIAVNEAHYGNQLSSTSHQKITVESLVAMGNTPSTYYRHLYT